MADVSQVKLPNGDLYTLKDEGALQLTGGQVTGPVTFEDSVTVIAPAGDNNPATKKYVDDAIGSIDVAQSDWEEDDTTSSAHVLNRPAIRAGEGERSVVIGQIEQVADAAIYTLYLTGEANALTYTYTTEDTLPTGTGLKNNRSIVYYENAPSGFGKCQILDAIDTTNHTITLTKTFSSEALSNAKVLIYFKYKMALGGSSIAEGIRTFAAYDCSHAEGSSTRAIGAQSHAEGYLSISLGNTSHAEGSLTRAIGNASHVEGSGTISASTYQHVQGKYNIEDANGVYADIIGNGTSSARSNAYTLDWSGNGWYAGKVTVGAQPTADMDVATKKYVDDIEIPQPEDDTLVLNLLTEYGYAAPIADASGNIITEDNGTLVLG